MWEAGKGRRVNLTCAQPVVGFVGLEYLEETEFLEFVCWLDYFSGSSLLQNWRKKSSDGEAGNSHSIAFSHLLQANDSILASPEDLKLIHSTSSLANPKVPA